MRSGTSTRDNYHLKLRELAHGAPLSTVYRTLRQFEEIGVIESHALGDQGPHYEPSQAEPHDHLIDAQTRQVLEFRSRKLETLFRKVARARGYRLVSYRLELFGEKARPDRDGPTAVRVLD